MVAPATVLVVSGPFDATCAPVIEELTGRGVDVVRLDTADFPTALRLSATLTGRGWTGRLTVGSRSVDLESIRSVWWRRPGEFHVPDEWRPEAREFAASEARSGFLGVLAALPVLWVNHPAANADAGYKPWQLAEAARCGLTVPATVVTNDEAHARMFVGDGQVIFKAMGGGVDHDGRRAVIPTTVVAAKDIDPSITCTATLLQEYVNKAFEVRLTVIGERMFPIAIHAGTDATRLDWRRDYGALTYDRVELPPDVREGVRRLMARWGLFFSALDFAVTPDGIWTFLEINPNGQWHWLTHTTDAPMVSAMADALAEGKTVAPA